jgi:uncharacterized protein
MATTTRFTPYVFFCSAFYERPTMSRSAQFAIFFVIVAVVLTAFHAYLWLRLIRDTALPSPWKQVAACTLAVLLASIPIAAGIYKNLPSGAARLIGAIPFVWLGVMMLLLFWFFAVDLMKLVALLSSRIGDFSFTEPLRLLVARIAAAVGVALVVCLSMVAVRNASGPPTLTELDVRMPRLPRDFDGYSIVQIGDLHIGGSLSDRVWVEQLVAKVNALHPDIVAITGDVVDGSPTEILDGVAPLAGLRAKRGVFFVAGNHEHYSGFPAWVPVFEKLGFRILSNERVSIGEDAASFDLIGVDDFDGRRMSPGPGADIEKATAGRDPGKAAVLLSHQPKIAAEAAKLGIDLVLAGHTHGGQIWPFSALVRLQQPYLRGLYRVSAGTQIYVSDGTGTWGPPMRLGTHSEVVRIVLRAE